MTAPTTREEFRIWWAARLVGRVWWDKTHDEVVRAITARPDCFLPELAQADADIAALDTFAVVCPREPTRKQRRECGHKYMVGDMEECGRIRYIRALAASPFAPKEPTDGSR